MLRNYWSEPETCDVVVLDFDLSWHRDATDADSAHDMGGNIITLDTIINGWGKVHTFDYANPGMIRELNYMTNPDLVHKFTIVGWSRKSKQTYWARPVQGDVYWPLVSSKPVWIQMERLEAFPVLPMEVVASTTQDIRKEPKVDSPLNGRKFREGETGIIME